MYRRCDSDIGINQSRHSRRIVPITRSQIALAFGLCGGDLRTVSPKPVFHGDTIRVESEVLEARESRSRPDNGIVVFAHRGYNQREELVMSCKRTALMLKRPPGGA
jgi:hypothetical protein